MFVTYTKEVQMKKILFLGAIVSLLFACETEENLLLNENDTANATAQVDLRTMDPNASLDTQSDGMYAGIIATNDTQFHGKLWINLHNDQQYSAMVEDKFGELHYFELTNTFKSTYTFSNSNGSFEFNATNPKNTEITNVVYNGVPGNARVLKETSQTRMTPIMGNYDSFGFGDPTIKGTWNFIAQDQMGFEFNAIEETVITTNGGKMFIERLADSDFEGFEPGCWDFGGAVPPVFANYPDTPDIPDDPMTPEDESALRDFNIQAAGQIFTAPVVGNTIIYDVAFSQDLADGAGAPYTIMTGFPTATNAIYFDPPLDPMAGTCLGLDFGNGGQGAYAIGDSSLTVIDAGNIFILNVADLTPPPPGLTAPSNTIEMVTAKTDVQD